MRGFLVDLRVRGLTAVNGCVAGYHNPPAIITRCEIENTLVGDGCQLRGSTITNAVMGRNCFIDEGCTIQDSVIIGNRCG